MPTNKPNSISSLRGRFDPHYKLSGKVEGLEKGVSDQVSQIHKTISKSFVTQRKTLARVLGLEKRVNNLEIQEAAEEQAKENLDDILKDIHQASPEEVKEYNSSVPMTDEEKEFVGEESKFDAVNKSVATKKKPKAKKSKISASAFKKGTSQESLEERVERIAQNKVDEAAADLHRQTKQYKETESGLDQETGEQLSSEERKRRFKLRKGNISTSKFFDKGEPKALPVGEKGGELVKIDNSVTSIVETLKEDQKQDKKQQGWFRKTLERFKRRKKENKLEFKVFDGIKKTATKLLAPMKNAWSSFLGFIGKVILGRILFKILKWMGNKDNQSKLQSIIKFFKDWWPTMLAAYLLFGNAFGRMAVKMGVMVARFAVRLITKIIPKLIAGLAKMKIGKLLKGIPGGGKLAPLIQGGMMIGGGMLLEKGLSGGGEDFSGEFDGIQQEFNEGGLVQHFENGAYVDDGLGYGIPGDTRTFLPGKIDPNNLSAGAGEMVVPKGATNAITGKEKEEEEARMLKEINKERAFMGIEPPLTKITYSQGVYLAKPKGPGPRTKEYTDTVDDWVNMTRTTEKTKWVEGEGMSYSDSVRRLTPEEKEEYLANNPYARIAASIKDQMELNALGDDISASARPQKLKQGGFVSGPGGVDKVPARLTAGEFVMSKGAVQKYGVNTLAGMNAAGGGTNIPTLRSRKPGYEGGGLVTVPQGTINSYQDLIKAGVEVEDIVTGSGRFGSVKWIEKIPKKGLFGREKKKMMRDKWYVSGVGSAIDKELAMSTEDYVNMRMGWSKASPAKVESKAPPKLDRITGDPGERTPPKLDRGESNIQPRKTATVITPSEKKKVTVVYEEEKQNMADKSNTEESSKEIPQFSVIGGRSGPKIKVLGISV